jgi:prephenate dehydratase
VGEHFLRIRHQLLGIKGAKLDGLKTVYSQAPALGQCRKIIRDMKLAAQNWYDTAGSAKHIAELADASVAAIASSLAGEIYGLEVLKADVEDEPHNRTRFLIMAREEVKAPHDGAPVITTFIFRVRNVPAALYKALGGFATNGVNMKAISLAARSTRHSSMPTSKAIPRIVACVSRWKNCDSSPTSSRFSGFIPRIAPARICPRFNPRRRAGPVSRRAAHRC